jgi:hypothetical protein
MFTWCLHLRNETYSLRIGNDASWAPPNLTHTYFRNFQLFAGTSPSDLQGSQVKNSAAQGRVQMFIAGPLVIAFSILLGLLI